MKDLFRITILLMIVVVVIGAVFDSNDMIVIPVVISVFAWILAGVKAIIDPLNFDWITPWFFEVDKKILEKHQRKTKISNRILGLFIIGTSLFILYVIVTGG